MRKYAVLAKYLSALSIDIACIQEHHVTSLQEENTLCKHFNKLGYNIMLNFNSAGRGGSCMIWKHSWICHDSLTLSCRIIMSKFSNVDGQQMGVIGAHFDHDRHTRKALRLCIVQLLDKFQGHLVMMADHNSLIVPARDCDSPAEEKTLEILDARDTEVASLPALGLMDAWCEVHNLNNSDHQDVPPGYTFGHSIHDSSESSDRSKRRLDRIHLSESLLGHLSTAFTNYLCRSDLISAWWCCALRRCSTPNTPDSGALWTF